MKQYTVKVVTHDGKTLIGDPKTKEKAIEQMEYYIKKNSFKSVTLVERTVTNWKEVKK